MEKMGTWATDHAAEQLAGLAQKYPIIFNTLTKSRPVQLVSNHRPVYGEELADIEWLVEFSNHSRISLDYLAGEGGEADYAENYLPPKQRQQHREIKALCAQVIARHPQLQQSLAELTETVCV